jgi:NAD(P)-dependent dehydrogenase (short-subunit alcohol dehydrogenase family)
MSGAIVTGGTAGIGAACVERLARDGFTVAFTGRDAGRGAELAARTGATFIPCDHADRADSDRGIAEALAAAGPVTAFVANAGILRTGLLTKTTDADFVALVETNLTAPFRCTRQVFAHMRDAGGGSIVIMASDSGIRGSHRIAAYSATKAAVICVAELFAAEGATLGIRCNALCPGTTRPGMAGDDPSTWRPSASGAYPDATDVAAAASWLVGPESRWVSGASLRLDGATAAALALVTRA